MKRLDLHQRITRRRWDLERFGLTPSGALARMRPPDAPRVLSISIPKAGTHLVERALCLHPLLHRRLTRTIYSNQPRRLDRLLARHRQGEVLCGHLRHTPEIVGPVEAWAPRTVLVVRDPRDIVVSKAHYSFTSSKPRGHDAAVRLPALRDRLSLFIQGDELARIPPIGRVLEEYAGWFAREVRVVRYEELVDPETRLRALESLFVDLDIPLPPASLEEISEALVSEVSVTFRRGLAGEWSEALDDDLRLALERSAGKYMKIYGYA